MQTVQIRLAGAAQDEANNPGLDTTTTVQDGKKTAGKSRSTFSAARRSFGL